MTGALKAVFAAGVLAAMSTASLAGPFEDGVTAYDRNDYSTAMRNWRSLADQGNPAAQSNIALMYAKGQGVSKDYVQAHMWASLSASKGHQEGVKNRDSIAKGMTPTEIADAQKRAGAWKPTGVPVQAQASAPAPTQTSAPAQTSAPQPSRSSSTSTTTIIRR
jgi:TPR repeat protein